ncbi:glycoside hydrolase family 28 protein, partial [Daedalea quercina L-15889]
MAIRVANLGGSNSVNVWGDNYWLHDAEVTNYGECVIVKSPASNVLVQQICCNQSGGSAVGSSPFPSLPNTFSLSTASSVSRSNLLTYVRPSARGRLQKSIYLAFPTLSDSKAPSHRSKSSRERRMIAVRLLVWWFD